MTSKIILKKSAGNIFEDVGFCELEAKRLQFRSFLMVALMKYIQDENISQKEAALRFGVSQSRISNLTHFKIDLFSTDTLLDMLEKAGFSVYAEMEKELTSAINKPRFNFPTQKIAYG